MPATPPKLQSYAYGQWLSGQGEAELLRNAVTGQPVAIVDTTGLDFGRMLSYGRNYMQTAWWISVFPGLAIMFTVLGLNLLGDWLRDVLDPQGSK